MTGSRRCGWLGFFLISILAVLALGCATQPSMPRLFGGDPPGFWMALIHGFVVPFALVGSLFTDFRIYAFPNAGFFYDLGFLLGLSAWGGGTAYAGRRG